MHLETFEGRALSGTLNSIPLSFYKQRARQCQNTINNDGCRRALPKLKYESVSQDVSSITMKTFFLHSNCTVLAMDISRVKKKRKKEKKNFPEWIEVKNLKAKDSNC